MCDPSLDRPRVQAKRGKAFRPKRSSYEPGRAVFDGEGNLVAQVQGRHVTDADVAQAAALVRWMPSYAVPIDGGSDG